MQGNIGLEALSREQLQAIHSASLYILEEVGSIVNHDEAVGLLKKAGAHVENGNLVFIPRKLVEQAIRTAPPSFIIFDRSGEPALLLEGKRQILPTLFPHPARRIIFLKEQNEEDLL